MKDIKLNKAVNKIDGKYLNDGRKVVVVGQLNNIESIVQEVFVTGNGDEIPSGERFTVKSLHDEPVLSYKEKTELKAEKTLLNIQSKIKDEEKVYKENYAKAKAMSAILASSKKLVDLLPSQDIEAFTMFMTGTVEYLVVDSYTITPPTRMMDKVISWSDGWGESHYDSIKLLSVLGKSNGELEYRINQYSDGSGSGDVVCKPFTNNEDAVDYIKYIATEKIKKDRLSKDSYQACVDMGITFSNELIDIFNKKMLSELSENIKNIKDRLEKTQVQLKEYEDSVKDFTR